MDMSRRSLMRGTGMLALAGIVPARALADETATHVSADEALAMLRAGNRAFVAGNARAYPFDDKRRREIARGQTPFAAIVCCSDSRAGPEQIFQAGLGELFVIRNAGNTTASAQSLGSVEYSVAKVHVPLLVVLGHSKCGAVDAANAIVAGNARFPGSIEAMVEPIVPAALAMRGAPGDPIENSVRENVRRVVARLRSPDQPLLYPPQREGKLRVVGAEYDLETGVVDFFDLPEPVAVTEH